MKTTHEFCFGHSLTSCAIALDVWQQHNCRICQKARFTNPKTGKSVRYYCAIQEQIEEQAGGFSQCVNIRTYNAVHGRETCAYIKPGEQSAPDVPVIDAQEFARGHQIVMPEKPVQPVAQPKSVVDVEQERRKQADEIMRKINAGEQPEMDEQAFKRKIHNDVKEMLDAFTWDEHKRIAYVPLVMQCVAWRYAFMAKQYAANNRISELKKMSRSIVQIYDMWMDTLRKDLDTAHIKRLQDAADEWMNDTSNDRVILQIQVSNAYLHEYREMTHRELFVLATCCRLLATFVQDYQRGIDEMVEQRLKRPLNKTQWPYLNALVELMNGIIQDFGIETTPIINNCLAVMRNRIERIKWID